jgi:hypothetical protein
MCYGASIGKAWSVPIGGHGHETVVKLRRALFHRTPVDCVAVRPGRHRTIANRNRRNRDSAAAGGKAAAARARGATAADGGKTAAGGNPGAGGKPRCIPPHLAGHVHTIARAEFGHGEACRAGAKQRQLPRRLPDQLQNRQRPLARMLAVRRGFLHHLPQPPQLQKLHRVPGDRTVPRLEAQRRQVVLLEPRRGGTFQGRRREARGAVGAALVVVKANQAGGSGDENASLRGAKRRRNPVCARSAGLPVITIQQEPVPIRSQPSPRRSGEGRDP